MTDEKNDKLFEGMSRETARKVANQGSPKAQRTRTATKKKAKGK